MSPLDSGLTTFAFLGRIGVFFGWFLWCFCGEFVVLRGEFFGGSDYSGVQVGWLVRRPWTKPIW
jgi:hypothetical protein